jgi:hypothetical protein
VKSWVAAIGLGVVALIALAPPSATRAAPIPEYRASYRAIDETAASSADVSLSYDSVAGSYTLVVKRVDKTAREIETTLRFDLVDDRVRPLAYRSKDSRCASCTLTVRFAWDARGYHLNTRGNDSVGSLVARDGSLSGFVGDVGLLVAMLPGRRGLAGFDNALTVKSLGTVELATALGPVHADGHALQGPPEATLWLAQELEHLPVRIQAFSIYSFATVQIVELQGIELSAAPGAVAAERAATGAPLAAEESAAATMPEYRAVYRVDDHRTVNIGQMEIAVSHGDAPDSYEFVARVTETKRPERPPLVIEMSFRLVGDRVQPLGLHMEQRAGRRPYTVGIEFDWALHDAVLRYDEDQLRYSLVAFDDRDERDLRMYILEPLAEMLVYLPGNRELAGFDDMLSAQSLGAAEISLPMGTFPVERLVLRGTREDMTVEVWRARELADLPVRFSGPVMGRRETTMELVELHGLDRAAAGAPAAQ